MFLNPAYLLAIAGAAIPLWLHLSRRRKYRELPIGTLRFLNEAVRERKKKSRLEEIPLLLMRMAVVALLAFVFARPFFLHAEKAAEKAAETIILVDASGSVTPEMAAAARQAAEKALTKVGKGNVKLAQFADEVQLIDSLDRYHPTAGSPTRVEGALSWALDQLSATSGAGKVVLISHLASSHLPSEPPRVWPPRVELELVPLEPPSVDNAAIRRVTLLTPYVDEEMELEVLLWMPRGRASEESRTVLLEADGLRQTAVVAPGGERVVFKFRPPKEEIRGWVSVKGGDAWPVDDRRPFAARWTEPARVLLVDGQPGSTPFEGQAYFIEKALRASGAAHGKSPFKPEIVYALEGRSGDVDLTGVKAIALCGVTELPQSTARRLEAFVAKGGGLITIINGKWTAESTAALVETGLFPEGLALTGGEEKRAISQWDREHPALAQFDGRDGGDLRSFEWRDACALQLGATWKALATLDTGHVLLAEKARAGAESGAVLACLHPLNREWSDTPREALFAPFVKSLFATLGHVQMAPGEIPVLSPGVREQREPGYYSTEGRLELVAPSSDEMLMATAGESAFRTAFGLPNGKIVNVSPPAPENTETRSRPGEIWPWALIALLVLLALENFAATKPQPASTT